MNYKNTFISQSTPFNFLNSIHDYLHKKIKKNFFFELVFSTDNEYSDNIFNKYKCELEKCQIFDQEIIYFKGCLFKKISFINDVEEYLKNDGFLIIHIFFDLIDLNHIYENGFEKTINQDFLRLEMYRLEMYRLEMYRLEWEVIKLPNPYLYVDKLPDSLYQQIDNNYDLINLGQSTISLRAPWHITLDYITNKSYSDEQIFNEKNECFLKFHQLISDISKQLCDDE